MRTTRAMGMLLLVLWASAHADEASETIEHSCDSDKKQFQLHYQIFWNTPAPGGSDFMSAPGEQSHTCMLDGTLVKTDLVLYEPSGQGVCGGVPGGYVRSLRLGEARILKDMPLNSCDSSWLDHVVVKLRKEYIEITFCGSYYRIDKGEQMGCFMDRHKKSQLPQQLYSGANFPFERFQPRK